MAKKNKTEIKSKIKSKIRSNIKSKSNPKLNAKTKSNAKPKVLTKGKLVTKIKAKGEVKERTIAKTKVKIVPKGKSKVAPKLKTKASVVSRAMPKTMPKDVTKSKIKVSLKPAKKTLSKIDFQNWVTPLDDRLLVRISEGEKMTPGGLYIPDTVTDVSGNMKGVVAAVGRGHLDKKGKIRPLDVKKGDEVIFSQFSGSKIEYQGETVIFLRESDVLGIVNN